MGIECRNPMCRYGPDDSCLNPIHDHNQETKPMLHFKVGDSLPEGGRRYRKKTIATLVKMDAPFVCDSREGRELKGNAGDFIAADGHGGFYPISPEFHAANYEEVTDEDNS